MATDIVALGRRVFIGLVLIAASLELMADAIASAVGQRFGESLVYLSVMVLMVFVGIAIDGVKNFLGE